MTPPQAYPAWRAATTCGSQRTRARPVPGARGGPRASPTSPGLRVRPRRDVREKRAGTLACDRASGARSRDAPSFLIFSLRLLTYIVAHGGISPMAETGVDHRVRDDVWPERGNSLRLVVDDVLSDLALRLKSVHFDTREDHARARRGRGRARAGWHASIGIACAFSPNANARLRIAPPRWRDVPSRRRRYPRRASRPPTTRTAKRVRRVRRRARRLVRVRRRRSVRRSRRGAGRAREPGLARGVRLARRGEEEALGQMGRACGGGARPARIRGARPRAREGQDERADTGPATREARHVSCAEPCGGRGVRREGETKARRRRTTNEDRSDRSSSPVVRVARPSRNAALRSRLLDGGRSCRRTPR